LAHKELTDLGGYWLAMSEESKMAFLEGMSAAFRVVCLNSVMPQDTKNVDAKELNKRFGECITMFYPYRAGVVKETMTSLYQDRANSKIPFDDMYGMALFKIKGEPIEENLKILRQKMEKLSQQVQ
jgi:hypothetical protein